jgi:regulatory protein
MTGTPGSRPDRRAAHEARRDRRAAVTDPGIVMEAAAGFLAVRSRSVSETRRRLLQLGYGESIAEEVLDRLGRMGYLDDRAFAQAWLESRDRSRPRGETALRQELRRKGLDDAVIRVALSDRAAGRSDPAQGRSSAVAVEDEDLELQPGSVDRDAARRLLARKTASLARETDPRKRCQKAYALLARNGFDPGTCRDVSLEILIGPDADATSDPGDEAP